MTKEHFLMLLDRQSRYPEDLSNLIQNAKKQLREEGTPESDINEWIHDPRLRKGLYKPKPAATQTMLNVPFDDKDRVKSMGARWSVNRKSWYVDAGADLNRFTKWLNN
jgi:putative DNA primase/helicase